MTTGVRWLAGITMALVLIQAALIGQAWFLGDPGKQALHGWLGSVSLLGAIAVAGLAILGVRRGELDRTTIGLGIVVVLLMIAQLGLGYMGRRQGWAAALHIPNGVLIAGLLASMFTVSLVSPAPSERPRA